MRDIEDEGRHDWLTFIDFLAILAEDRGVEHDLGPELATESVGVAVSMVRARRLVPGCLGDRLEPWPLSPEEAAQRIEQEAAEQIAEHGRVPLGEIGWFTLPEYVRVRAPWGSPTEPEDPA